MKRRLQYHFIDPTCLLVINPAGQLRKIYTPFRVQCIKAQAGIPRGSWVIVEEVYTSEEGVLHYCIQDRLLSYHHFRVQIRF